nr:hypothetical protein Itr_chr08CG14680 [Ipomoea trifida]
MFVERGEVTVETVPGKRAATTACCLEGGAGESHGEGDVAAATNHGYAPSSSSVAITIWFGDGRGEPPSRSLFTAERGENTATSPSLLRRKLPSRRDPPLTLLRLPFEARRVGEVGDAMFWKQNGILFTVTLRKESHADAAIGTATIRHRSREREGFRRSSPAAGKRAATTACCLEGGAGESHGEGDVAAATNHGYAPSSSSVAITIWFGDGRGEPPSRSLFTAERGENTATSPSLLRRKLPSRRDPPLTLLRLPFEARRVGEVGDAIAKDSVFPPLSGVDAQATGTWSVKAASDEAKAATTSGDVLSPFTSGASLLDGGGKRASAVPSSGEQRQRHGQQRRATLLREVPPASMA